MPTLGSVLGRVTNAFGRVFGGYGLLVQLGLLPTVPVGIGVVAGFLTGNLVLALSLALVLSVVASVVLGAMFWRQKQKMDWMLAVIRSVPPPAPLDQAWKFKGDLSEVPLTEQEFEAALARATDAARESVAPDADVRFLYVDFWLGSMVFDGYSPSTRKGFSMTVRPSGLSVHHIERDRSSFIFTAAMQAPWRSDPSWTRLITASWLRERPFEGHITLHAPGFDGSTAWRIEYHEIDEGLSISGGRRTYRFEAGELIVT